MLEKRVGELRKTEGFGRRFLGIENPSYLDGKFFSTDAHTHRETETETEV